MHCAVVGSPIAHSRSPVLHRAAHAALGLTDWTYDRVDIRAGELGDWLSRLDDSWRGLSVTMPHKQAALACAATASELATSLGAANTLTRAETGWHADNTDVAGLLGALTEAGVTQGRSPTSATVIGGGGSQGRSPISATVVGGGGTAAAALAALAALGQPHVDIVVRGRARAQRLPTLADRFGMTCRLHPWPGTFSGESHHTQGSDRTFSGESHHTQGSDRTFSGESALAADLVISTVPAAATSEFLAHTWRRGQTVVDVTYSPWPPALVTAAHAQGATAVDGAIVLLWQAVAQVELMTGSPAPVEAMRAALLPGGNLAPA